METLENSIIAATFPLRAELQQGKFMDVPQVGTSTAVRKRKKRTASKKIKIRKSNQV